VTGTGDSRCMRGLCGETRDRSSSAQRQDDLADVVAGFQTRVGCGSVREGNTVSGGCLIVSSAMSGQTFWTRPRQIAAFSSTGRARSELAG
jgi:hypothetical protein